MSLNLVGTIYGMIVTLVVTQSGSSAEATKLRPP